MSNKSLQQNKPAFFSLTVLALGGAMFLLTACENDQWPSSSAAPQDEDNPPASVSPTDHENPTPNNGRGNVQPNQRPSPPAGNPQGQTGGDGPIDRHPTQPLVATRPPVAPGPTAVPAPNTDLIEKGEKLFTAKACKGCHSVTTDRLVGPGLAGVYGKGEDYVRESITDPAAYIVKAEEGETPYSAMTLPFPVSSDELDALIAYIKTL